MRLRIIQKIYELKAEASDIPDDLFSEQAYNYLGDIEDFVKREYVVLNELIGRLERATDLEDVESVITGLKELL